MLAISFSEASLSRSTTPHSRRRLPSISMPMSGVPRGAMMDAITVTTMGNRMRVVLDTGACCTMPMTICFSRAVVSTRMIGGWISGTSDMYE